MMHPVKKFQESVSFDATRLSKLKKLVAQGEGQTLEFKRKAAHPEKIIREMIAFANTSGGVLLVGISDDGTIPGVKYPEDESLAIKKALGSCRPPLRVSETLIPLGSSRTVLYYDIPESRKKLHYLVDSANAKTTFVRVADKSIKASYEVREIIKRAQHKKDIRFHYGEHEHTLIKYLDANPFITLKKFMELSRLKRFQASRKLVLLVLANVLSVTPNEKGDLFSLAGKSPQ